MIPSYLDLFFLALILLITIVAAIKGFIKEIFGFGAPVIAIWVSILFYKKLAVHIENGINIHWLSIGISFLSIFIVCFLIIKIIQKIFEAIFDCEIFKSLDHILGFIFGIVEGLAVVVVILIVLSSQPWFNVEGLLDSSIFFRLFGNLISTPIESISDAVIGVSA